MLKLNSFLWFDNQAADAAKFYTSLFPNSKLGHTAEHSDEAAKASGRPAGPVMVVDFELAGQKVIALNGGPMFKFTQALSFFVWCETEAEQDKLWKTLSAGGKVHMGLDKYEWGRYGWTSDKYGLGWQLMQAPPPGQRLAPSFLFVNKLFGKGEEAIQHYQKLFPNSKTDTLFRDEKHGTIAHAQFSLSGQKFVLMEGAGEHAFTFNEAFSIMVSCDTQEEIDRCWNHLAADPNAGQCGWLKDKYGVSWQIVPSKLAEWGKSAKVMQELMKMKKLDMAKLKTAYERG